MTAIFDWISAFRFENPWLLGLLILVPLVWLGSRRFSRPARVRYADVSLVKQENRPWRIVFRPILKILRIIGLALMIIGLARPQSGESRQVVTGDGVDIALALDISGSMASLDFEPSNRLSAAKDVIEEFVDDRTFDRIGLVVFAEEAFAQSPLTIDHNVMKRQLRQIDLAPNLGLSDGTAIGMGLATAANMLKDTPTPSKVLILLTDGVNNSGQIDPFTAAEAAQTLGIKVYTIAVGKEGQVPFPTVNIFGDTVITYQESVIDQETLIEISNITGGQFFRAEDTDSLRQIYEVINELETTEVDIQVFNRYNELAFWVLIPALALLILEIILRNTIFRTIP